MGRFLKALVMTFLLMEITAIVSLTAIWIVLSRLHASPSVLIGGIATASVGLCLLAFFVFRRALAAEERLQTEDACVDEAAGEMAASPDLPVNAVGPARPRYSAPQAGIGLTPPGSSRRESPH